jgi:2-C-methyl-D-erythritol 4-phosphate cytidylyltransferase
VGVVVPAAGAGRRLGGGEPKALATLGGRALLAYAVETLEANDCTTAVVVVSHADAMEATAKLLAEEGFTKVTAVVAGGPTRQASVAAGLRALPDAPAMWPSTTSPGRWSARGRSTGCWRCCGRPGPGWPGWSRGCR